jgi:hypothetical protein
MTSRFLPLAALFGAASFAFGSAGHAQGPDLSSLHDALHLTRPQEEAWRTYVAAIRPDPTAEGRQRAAAQMAAHLTTPRRVDLINAEMEEDMRAIRRQGDAVKAFYAGLTSDQQRIFDVQTQKSGSPSDAGSGSGGPPLHQPSGSGLRPPSSPQ